MSPLRRQLPKGMWPLRWMRYTCDRTHKQSCFSPSRSSDSRTDLLWCFVFTHFIIFLNSILTAVGVKREQQTRRAGSVPGRSLIKNHFNIRLPAHGEKCLRRRRHASPLTLPFLRKYFCRSEFGHAGFCLVAHWQQLLPKSRVRNFV